MHRAHDFLTNPALAVEASTGEVHLRHHISPNGFYRGRKVVKTRANNRLPVLPCRHQAVRFPHGLLAFGPSCAIVMSGGGLPGRRVRSHARRARA